MFGKDSAVSKKIDKILEQESQREQHQMLPIYEENGVYNFYLKTGSRGSISPLEEKKDNIEGMSKEELLKLVKSLQQAVSLGKGHWQP